MSAENDAVEDVTEQPRVAIVTGGSSGIGTAAAVQLARQGWSVAIVGRDTARLEAALAQVRAAGRAPVSAHRCDFGVLADVRALAGQLREKYPRIDLLANNAGGAVSHRMTTVDGFELTMQSNHLAPFLLSHELREQLRGGRIVNTASRQHVGGNLNPDDLNSSGRYLQLSVYGTAKQSNILFAAEAARRWPEILSTSYHPGVVRTRFGHDTAVMRFFYRFAPGLRTPEKGAETLVWLAEAPADTITPGAYYMDKRVQRPAAKAADPALAARLWEASLAAVGLPATNG